ncbi:peptide chain release factor 1 [Batrachochytrium salamandrivorans]|nr:peptide chain release factor 1 [Batrachochytrium salamandrivorans]
MSEVDEAEREEEAQLAMWKLKKTISMLENSSKTMAMLVNENGTASNIKSRVNRQSVQSAITCTQQRLKLYNRIPETGLCLFCGEVLNDEGKSRMLTLDLVPTRELGTSKYLCDSKFDVAPLKVLLTSEEKWAFIVMDGHGCLFGQLSGNAREILHKYSVDLPKKHGRGGQSSARFGRIRMEKRANYVRKVSEDANRLFIGSDNMPNVKGIILAGSAEFKQQLQLSDIFDPRLKAVVIKLVDTSYGMENGFNQAIELSQEALKDTKFVHEKKIISKFFEHISLDTGQVCFGINDTTKALEMGAIETLVIWEDLEYLRVQMRNIPTDTITTLYLTQNQLSDEKIYKDPATGAIVNEVMEKDNFIEWLSEKKERRRGARLELVSNKSQEGAQFQIGFGGIAGIMRWKLEMEHMADTENPDDDDEWDSDY